MTPQELAWFKDQEREINAWRTGTKQTEPKKELEAGREE